MAFLLNKTALSKLRLNPQKTDESLMLSRRGIHIEPGAREKALLAADPSLKRFKSHKQSVRTLKRVGDVLTIVVVAGSPILAHDSISFGVGSIVSVLMSQNYYTCSNLSSVTNFG
ncbi:hypothetical protein KY290_029077 [Solanum tuberosum]|uniref:Uncharacterized protein n=1 Tax=Solanum tuberosum TaxID=4113 RepID=A0ABQ7UMZ0_SOLTU|nr:hypothetical protein KY290_029077 [Solanum tuberosum]